MSDYGGRLIRATEPTVSTTTASGIWTLEEALQYKQAGTWPTQLTADPNFKQTVLLLHGDGTNGAQNNTFLDSSTNNFTITRNGNTTQGTFSPFSVGAGEWSNFFDGTGDYLSSATGSAVAFGTGDFSFELWVYPTNLSGVKVLLDTRGGGTGVAIYTNEATANVALGATALFTGASLSLNEWTHLAVTRSGTTIAFFVNGSRYSSATNTTNFGNNTTYIGTSSYSVGGNLAVGYLSNARIIKGTAVYDPTQTTLTVPTSPLTAISGTSLLTCQSNRFVDNSTNAFAITRNGDVRVTPFSPFAPTAEYDAGTNGGSGYFDGSNTRLNTPTSSQFNPAGDFTIGLWFYPNSALTINQNLIGNLTSNVGTDWLIQMVSGTLQFYTNGTTVRISSATAIRPFEWNYITMTRSSNVISAHANGTLINTYSQSGAFGSATKTIEISNATSKVNGYLSGIILRDGTADTTVPTAPPTNVSGTSLLLNFTNAGIFDNTGKNNLETVGNAQIDTAVKKYGTGSLEFDGTGDYLKLPVVPESYLGATYTIEAWINLANVSGTKSIYGQTVATTGTYAYLLFYVSNSSLGFYVRPTTGGTETGLVAGTLSANTWHHVAISVNNTTGRLFIDGTQVGSNTTISTAAFTIVHNEVGYFTNGSGGYPMNGFIDDLRITKGVARYTANFTPPAAAFQDK